MPGQPSAQSRSGAPGPAVLVGVTVLVAVLVFVVFAVAKGDGESPTQGQGSAFPGLSVSSRSGSNTSAISSTPATGSSAAVFSIDPITNPPLCATFSGTAPPTPGQTLWIVVFSDERKFYFNPVSPDTSLGRWTAPNVTLGLVTEPSGEPFTIILATAPEDFANRLKPEDYENGFANLPAGVDKKAQIEVVRGTAGRTCD
jgi:hypothetical protein